MPAELQGHEAALLNAVDAIRSLARIATPGRQIEVQRNCTPGCWGEGRPSDRSRLVHTPETWCRIALLFAGAPDLDASLLTLRRGMKQRGLVELTRSGQLRRQIEDWGGGVEVEGGDAVLVFDDGLGGFLPLSGADVSCEPLSFASAGIIPVPSTLMVMAEGVCVVKQTGRALYRYWQLAEGEAKPVRGLLARAARLVTEITLGRGALDHLVALDEIAIELATQGLAGAWPLGSALRYYRDQWEQHARRESCPEGMCLQRKAAPCHATCPANIDIPSFVAHLGQRRLSIHHRGHPTGQPAATHMWPRVPGAVRVCVCARRQQRCRLHPPPESQSSRALPGQRRLPETRASRRTPADGSGSSARVPPVSPPPTTCARSVTRSRSSSPRRRRVGCCATASRPTGSRLSMLDQELDQIQVLGIPIRTNTRVDDLDAFRKNYDAVFLGLGTQKSRPLVIDGVQQPFVLGGIDFLRSVHSGEPVRVGPRVVVVGGGNVAIDVALTALRQGAKHVDMVCLEKRREMPASPHEIENAVAEGVQLHPGWGPVRIDDDGAVTFQFCERTHNDNGDFDPTFDTGRLLTLEGDHVILAVGQGTDLAGIEDEGVKVTHGFIVADPKNLMTSVPGVFAGGDVEHGPRTVVEAVRSGKIAAASIDAWLRGEPIDPSAGQPVRRADVIPLRVRAARSHPSPPRRDARAERRRGPRPRQLRPDRRGPDRRHGTRRGPSLPALRRLHRLRPVHGGLQRDGHRSAAHGRHHRWTGSPTSTSNGPRNCASAAVPAPRCAPPAQSTSRITTGHGARSSPEPSYVNSHSPLQRMRHTHGDTRPPRLHP